jgi:cell division protein FtsB
MAYSKYRISHKKEVYYILCIVALIVILSFSLFGPGGYRLELQEQKARVEALERDINERKRSNEALRYDRDAWEKHAREKGYGKEGEIIQNVPE